MLGEGWLAIGVHCDDPAESHRLARCLGRAAARGLLSDEEVRAALTLDVTKRVPDHPALAHVIGRCIWAAREAECALRFAISSSERDIKPAVRNLLWDRRPAAEVMRAASARSRPGLSRRDVMAICRSLAAQLPPRRRAMRHG